MSSDLIYAPLSKLQKMPLADWIDQEFRCMPIKKMMIRRFKDNNADVREFSDTAAHVLRSYGGQVQDSIYKTADVPNNFDLPWDDDTLKLILAAIYKGFEHDFTQTGSEYILICLHDYLIVWFIAKYGKRDLGVFSWNW